jgi:excisionase family DNA binding protein
MRQNLDVGNQLRISATAGGKLTMPGKLTAVARTGHSRPGAHDVSRSRSSRLDEWLTVEEVCDELKVSRRTFDRWRARRTGPRSVRLGGKGPLRVRRSWLEEWLEETGPGAA